MFKICDALNCRREGTRTATLDNKKIHLCVKHSYWLIKKTTHKLKLKKNVGKIVCITYPILQPVKKYDGYKIKTAVVKLEERW